MKRLCFVLLVAACCVLPALFSADGLRAETLEGALTFDPGKLVLGREAGYDTVAFEGPLTTIRAGAPLLPVVQVRVALPPGAIVDGLDEGVAETMEVPGRFRVLPASSPLHIGDPPPADPFVEDPAVYGRDGLWPVKRLKLLAVEELWGQRFVVLEARPVQYNPGRGALFFNTRIPFRLAIHADPAYAPPAFNLTPFGRARVIRFLRALAWNPGAVIPPLANPPGVSAALEPGQYDYVIITPSAFASHFQPLADWRTKMGMPAKIVDRDWIYANYTGTSNAQKIKNFIRDAVSEWGTLYYLLGGDTKYIPYHQKNILGDDIPNDTYYARLNLTSCSWHYDVFVGRACVNDTAQVDTFVNKVLTYEKNPPADYGGRVFLMGFDLDGSTHGEQLKKKITSDWLPQSVSLSTEYDSEPGGHEADAKAYMNDGQNLVNHCDHANTSYIGVGSVNHGTGFTNSEAQSFTNGTKYSNFYTLGCWAGNYPSTCWGEALVRDDQGGITFTGNSRYGWYMSGSPLAFSGTYDQNWWEALFDPAYNAYLAGETLAVSLNMIFPGATHLQYIFTELNLLGDPGLHLWTAEPEQMIVTHAGSIHTGVQDFVVQVESQGVPLAGALVCLMKGDEVYVQDLTGAGGDVTFSIDPSTPGTLSVTVTAQNHRCYEGSADVTELTDPPVVTAVIPRCGPEAGATPITVTGSNFTVGPSIEVKIGGSACTDVTVLGDTQLTARTPAGTNGWADLTVSNSFGTGTLVEGFRFFPVGTDPFNGTDVHTESLDAPAAVTLIASGQAGNPALLFFSYGGGPQQTPYGVMGLDIPIYYVFTGYISPGGYLLLPLQFQPGYGPFDLYVHFLGTGAGGDPSWSWGGNNPNGSGSVWFHVNN